MATIASLNVSLSANSARLKRDLDRAGAHTQTWAQRQRARFSSVTGGVRGLHVAMVGLTAVMGTGRLLDNADALGKNAAAAGLSVEAYQRLQHGFSEAGISQAGFQKGQRTLNKIFADAGDGMSTAVDALGAVGLTYEDLLAMNPEDRMLAVARGLEGIEDPALRSAAAAELLGREMGTVVLDADQIIADGEGIAVVSEEAAMKAAEMNDAMDRMSTTIQSLLTNAIVPMLANMAPVIESIANFSQDNPMMAGVLLGLGALTLAVSAVGAPIVAITAAITAAILVFQNWDTIIDYLGDKWGAFGDKFPVVSGLIEAGVNSLLAPFRMVKDVVSAIFELFSGEGSFLDRLKAFGGNIVDERVTNNPVVKLMENLAGVLKVPLNAVIQMFEDMVNKAITAINELTAFDLGFIQSEGTNIAPFDLPAFADGGYVSGAGSSRSDSIPALLSNGEFVINANATSRFGPLLEAINSGTARFASGGQVGTPTTRGTSSTKSESEKTPAQRIASEFIDSLTSSFSEAMRTGDWKGFLTGLLDSFTSTIIDTFAESLFAPLQKSLEGWMSGLMGGGGGGGIMGGLFGGGGGGGLFGGLFSGGGLFVGMAEGGIVPSTRFSKSYADSVPTMLMPGELVVPKNQVDSFMGSGGSGGQTFNINVTGDVSRLTRSEIVKMMPEIAAGTNMLNKENGRR